MDKTPEELAADAARAAEEQAQADAAAAAANGKKQKARVLVRCHHGQPNDVVKVDTATLKQGTEAGELDGSKAAVAYIESLS